MAEIITAIGGVAAVLLSIYNVIALRRQRGLSADQTEVDLAKAAIEIHRTTTEDALRRMREQIDEKDERNAELLTAMSTLTASVSHMTDTIAEFLRSVNGSLPPEWRQRLTLLVNNKDNSA